MTRGLAIILLLLLNSCRAEGGNEPLVKLHQFELGNSIIPVREHAGVKNSNIVFIQLHHDEQTAVASALAEVNASGGKFISLENDGKRNVSFSQNGSAYRFDPNRIFSAAGREASLKALGNYAATAEKEVERLSDFILMLIPREAQVIALHNNTDNRYCIEDYKAERKGDALEVHINKNMDPDDFIFTTDPEVFSALSREDLNVVLQDNRNAKDDGSLSVWMGRQGRTYINIEAEHGHIKEQERMLKAVVKALEN